MYFGSMTSQVILFFTKVFPFAASFCAFSLSSNNSFTAWANLFGFSGGTKIPVSLLVINSGIPPTFVPITGTFRKNYIKYNRLFIYTYW